jgi:hypothetical protein
MRVLPILRLMVGQIISTLFLGPWLTVEVVMALKTGRIRHTDSTQVCTKTQEPAKFWVIVTLFTLTAGAWGYAVWLVTQNWIE